MGKRLFPQADPAGILRDLGMKNGEGLVRSCDEAERLRLCTALLPLADYMIASSESNVQGHLVKASVLEHVGIAELCNPAGERGKAVSQLRGAALSWRTLLTLSAQGNAMSQQRKLRCYKEHHDNCLSAISDDGSE